MAAPGSVMESPQACRGQDLLASGRVVPPRRVHRDQPQHHNPAGGLLLQQRGTAEQWIKEGKYAVRWTRLSCKSFDANQVRLQLHVLAYNLGNFLRRLALPAKVKHCSLLTLREKLIKTGARMVRHARYVTFQMAEVAVPHELYRAMLRKIAAFSARPVRAGPA